MSAPRAAPAAAEKPDILDLEIGLNAMVALASIGSELFINAFDGLPADKAITVSMTQREFDRIAFVLTEAEARAESVLEMWRGIVEARQER